MKPEIIGNGNDCPKCSNPMQRCRHKAEWKPKPRQPHYFQYWDRCRDCRHVQHYECAKVNLDTCSSKTHRIFLS